MARLSTKPNSYCQVEYVNNTGGTKRCMNPSWRKVNGIQLCKRHLHTISIFKDWMIRSMEAEA